MEVKPTGTRIKRLRDRKAWTQEHLARAASVSVRTVQRAEEGVMSAETLSAIAGALDVEVEALSASAPSRPRISAVLYYESIAMLDWLVEAFGFELTMKVPGPDGSILHAELTLDGARLLVGSPVPARGWTTPKLAGVNTQSLYVDVDDVDAHCAHARAAGAEVLSEPEDMHGDRRYLARDPEGHHWWFATPIVSD